MVYVEIGDTWKKINKSDIERMNIDKSLPQDKSVPLPDTEQGVKDERAMPLAPAQPASEGKAAANLDLRVKIGAAAGATDLQFDSAKTLTSKSDRSGENGQIDVVMNLRQASKFGPVFSAGVFRRRHSASFVDNADTTSVDYDATGVCVAAGIRLKASEQFHFEGKIELGLGQGKVTLDSPSVAWNRTDKGTYTSAAIIAGWYYAFSKPGFELGLEVGGQSFNGEFKILNNSGYWVNGNVSGDGGLVHLVIGYRF